MAINDSVPERRNLIILSISIIIFYLAGGQPSDHTIRLQMINVTFSNPDVLVYFVWVLLIWFCYRYWLVHQGSWRKGYFEELSTNECSFIYYKYLLNKFGLTDDYTKSLYEDRHLVYIDTHSPALTFKHVYTKTGNRRVGSDQASDTIEISSFWDRWVVFLCSAYLFFRRPSLSSYFTPYLLFVFAVALGLYHAIWP